MLSAAYSYLAEFAAVAAAGSQSQVITIDTDADFVVDAIEPEFQLDGAYLSAIDGTPIAATFQTISGSSLVLPTLAHLRVQMSDGANPWQKAINGVRVSAFKKYGINYLLSKPFLTAGNSLQVKLWNDGPAPIKGQLILVGRRVDRGAGQRVAAGG